MMTVKTISCSHIVQAAHRQAGRQAGPARKAAGLDADDDDDDGDDDDDDGPDDDHTDV